MPIGELKSAQQSLNRSDKNFTPFIGWKKDETKTVFFVTPMSEVPEVLFHQYVQKQVPGEDKTRSMTFMCRKDPAWREESGNTCWLCDVLRHKATKKYAFIAVEVETELTGKKITGVKPVLKTVKDQEGRESEVPAVGLILQSKRFTSKLIAFDQKRDISEVSWEISRIGETWRDTDYNFYNIEQYPDLTKVDVPDLREILDFYGSQEKYDKDIDENVTPEIQFENSMLDSDSDDIGEPVNPGNTHLPRDEFDALKDNLDSVESYDE